MALNNSYPLRDIDLYKYKYFIYVRVGKINEILNVIGFVFIQIGKLIIFILFNILLMPKLVSWIWNFIGSILWRLKNKFHLRPLQNTILLLILQKVNNLFLASVYLFGTSLPTNDLALLITLVSLNTQI